LKLFDRYAERSKGYKKQHTGQKISNCAVAGKQYCFGVVNKPIKWSFHFCSQYQICRIWFKLWGKKI